MGNIKNGDILKKTKNIIITFLLINIVLTLTGCRENKNEEIKNKVIAELGYVNIKIIDMLNGLNNITFENYTIMSEQVKSDETGQNQQSEQGQKEQSQQEGNSNSGSGSQGEKASSEQKSEKQEDESQDLINTTEMVTNTMLTKSRDDIEWNVLKPEIELLNETWSIVLLDLYSLNVDNNDILDFSSKLNTSMIAIKNEDGQASLTSLADLYASIPNFLNQINSEINLQRIRQTQMYVINAYSLASDITNPEINSNLQKAVDVYSQIISDTEFTKDKTFKTNKAYVLLNELVNSLDNKDSDVFYVKYKNFMETINEL